MTESISVDISGAVNYIKWTSNRVHESVKKLQFRLAFIGEGKMKFYSPVRTGTLRRSIKAYPKKNPWGIATDVTYAWFANVRSRKPHFIEHTVTHLERIAVPEAKKLINEVIK